MNRVVGFNTPYRKDGVTRVQWARVTGEHRNDPQYVIARDIHTGEHTIVPVSTIHTVMTASY